MWLKKKKNLLDKGNYLIQIFVLNLNNLVYESRKLCVCIDIRKIYFLKVGLEDVFALKHS